MSTISNYIPDTNPFRLAGPPSWFQRALWEFDPSLAIVPSRQGFFYRLAQRRPLKLPERIVNDVMKEQADTCMLASYSLVPVTTILATVNWSNPEIFAELRRRAPWRWGGADAFEKMVLAQDKKEEVDAASKNEAILSDLSKDAWRFYNKKIGLRSHVFDVKGIKSKVDNKAPNILPFARKPYKPVIHTAWGNVLKKNDPY